MAKRSYSPHRSWRWLVSNHSYHRERDEESDYHPARLQTSNSRAPAQATASIRTMLCPADSCLHWCWKPAPTTTTVTMFAERLRKNIQGAASVLLAPATTCLLVLHLERAVLTDPRLLHCVWCGKNSHSCCNTSVYMGWGQDSDQPSSAKSW